MQQTPQPTALSNQIPREPFRWLFTAEFKDGTIIEQTQEDKCLTRTDGTGSAFTDVLAREDELVAFHLYSVDGKEAASVDLITGAFIINNTPFHAHDQYFEPTQHKLRLIYHRETRIDSDIKSTVENDGTINQEDVGQRHYVNRYFIGWQTTTKTNKNVQATIAVG